MENEEDDDDDQSAQAADTYSDYMPLKRRHQRWTHAQSFPIDHPLVRLGDRHPDPVVETSSLASVELPDITYGLAIPDEKIRLNTLSALQLETIVYASQRHNSYLPDGNRAGFLIGRILSHGAVGCSSHVLPQVMERAWVKAERLPAFSTKTICSVDVNRSGSSRRR